ncbi:MAG: glycosyltransferase family 2 protein [Chitinophagaceae bacterium]|nr:glycosyltransferase family 2 protein [Chitinophagaceae bacterium]
MARVSIITPSFNRADIIHETAESIFRQTHQDWEWVIVDDGSTDNSWDLLESYAKRDTRVKIFKRDRDPKGAAVCRNIAVERATGKYVIFLDTDDLLASFCLEQRVRVAEEERNADVIVFPMIMFKEKPDDLKLLWNIDKDADDVERILMGDAVCQGTGTIWKRDQFLEVGAWRQDLAVWQDVELHLRTMLGGVRYKKRFDLLPDIFIRISEVSLSRTGFHSIKKWESRKRVFLLTLDQIQKLNLLEKYNKALKHVAIDLLINSARSGFSKEGNELLNLIKEMSLFSNKELKWFRFYFIQIKYKLNRIPFVEKILFSNIKTFDSEYDVTLNRIRYDGSITI